MKDDNGLYSLPVDFQQFREICQMKELYAVLEEKPKDALLCMSAAMHRVQIDFMRF